MLDKNQKPKKKAGRPRLLSDKQMEQIAHLYFECNWTAKRISDNIHPTIGEGTIRSMARRWRQRAA